MSKQRKTEVLNFRLTLEAINTFKEICEAQGESVSNTLNSLVNNFNNKFNKDGKTKN